MPGYCGLKCEARIAALTDDDRLLAEAAAECIHASRKGSRKTGGDPETY
jgi:hypothetical protein